MKTIIAYHGADLDGHCSGALAKLKWPDAEMIPTDYGRFNPDWVPNGARLVMLDFSLPMQEMVALAKRLHASGGKFVWVDHHKSAIEEWIALPKGDRDLFEPEFDASLAACELAWIRFFGDGTTEGMPKAVKLLGVYDTWRFTPEEKEHVMAFQHGMRTYETDPSVDETMRTLWAQVLGFDIVELTHMKVLNIIGRGRIVRGYLERAAAVDAGFGAFTTVLEAPEGSRLPPLDCVALSGSKSGAGSRSFDAAFDEFKHDAMLHMRLRSDGKWEFSLYAPKDKPPVLVYAKAFGGGGHPRACGFLLDEIPECILKNRKDDD